MSYLTKVEKWKNYADLDPALKDELYSLNDKQLKEVFTDDLVFGTGGLRGVLGVGTNRMNIYNVRKATLGFGQYLATFNDAYTRGVVIAHDNRFYSTEFALETAKVLSTMGFKVYLFSELRPTPELSFAVRHLHAVGGVMITASHNPKQYNGYKIYDENGCQLVPELADKVIENIAKIDDYFNIPTDKNHELIQYIDKEIDEEYIKAVNTIRINPELKGNSKVVYTPLHGTGQVFAADVLNSNGFNCYPVMSQMTNDPNFSGVKSSNPEDPKAFDEAIEYAKEIGAKLVLATDPDADRLGIGCYHDGEFVLINGNQTATIMVDYICSQLAKQNRLPKDGWVFSTNVSGDLPLKIAQSYGLQTFVTLTGFKFIGEQAKKIEGAGTYVFGYEESYGCLIKDFVRDKDSIQAILMICEIEAWCESQGMDIIDYLHKIYDREGYTRETQANIYMEGLDGKEKINSIMDYFRSHELDFHFNEIVTKEDNLLRIRYDYHGDKVVTSTIHLPKSNVIKYFFADGSWFVLRPSGTEPKLKVYFGVAGKNHDDSIRRNNNLREQVMKIVNSL